jgi:hypothetical protein
MVNHVVLIMRAAKSFLALLPHHAMFGCFGVSKAQLPADASLKVGLSALIVSQSLALLQEMASS